ncbi:putative reverse transcriptase domain-containing protein [Tanacetum coccineum]
MVGENIDNLTKEQYLMLTRGNQAPGVVRPEIRGNVNFEIKSQFMQEFREDTFSGNKNDVAHEHIKQVLDIVSLFNIPRVTRDAVMLRVFLITLTRAVKRPLNNLKTFATSSNREKRHCTKLGKDSHGPILGMTPTEGLTAIQTMADHSQKWHDGSPSQSVSSSNNYEGMAAILCDGPHLDKECPLNEDAKGVEEVKYDEGRSSPFIGTNNETHGVSFIDEQEDDNLPSEGLPCQLPPKEINPGSFTLPCTIGSLDIYVMADLGASINVMPKSMFEHLKLANLKETNMLVEMADMTKKVPLEIIENILVKIDKFLFSSDFMIMDMLKTSNETMILGRPFLETIHAEIDVFNKEISLGIRDDRIIFDMNTKSYEFTTPIEKAYMVNVVHGKDLMDIDCDLFLYESESCKFNRLLTIDPDIFTCDIDIQESYKEIIYRCCGSTQGEPETKIENCRIPLLNGS